MNEYAVVGAIVVCVFICMHIFGGRQFRRQKAILAERRPSPTRDEFVAMLSSDCEADVAELLWDELHVFYRPDLTPHPDDDVTQDMPIDHDEPNDWLARFCKINRMPLSDVSQWPEQEAATVRNLARWFSQNRRRLA